MTPGSQHVRRTGLQGDKSVLSSAAERVGFVVGQQGAEQSVCTSPGVLCAAVFQRAVLSFRLVAGLPKG